MEAQLKEAGVQVRLGVSATPEIVKEIGAEVVFMDAGGKPVLPPISGIEKAVTAEDVLSGKAKVTGKNVVIVGGGVTGLETAEYLAPDYQVTALEMLDKVGGNLYPSVVMHLAQEIMKNGGTIAKGKRLESVGEREVVAEDVKTGEKTAIPADTIILAMGVRANRPELEAFKEAFPGKVILIGDSDHPGQIYDALHSGHDRAFVY